MLSLKIVTWFSAIWIFCLIVAFTAEFAWNTKELDLDFESAWENGDLETLQYIISHELNQNSKNELLIRACNERNNTEIARLLLKNGADLKQKEWKPLSFAISQGNLPLLELLINAGANVNVRHHYTDTSILSIAAYHGNTEAMKLLIKNGANVDAKDIEGKKPLHFAVDRGNIEAVKLLIAEKGMNF